LWVFRGEFTEELTMNFTFLDVCFLGRRKWKVTDT
jgi:hypothetical protein